MFVVVRIFVFQVQGLLTKKIYLMASNAVDQNRVSKIVGYQITKGDFSVQSSNLPQRIAVLGEANNANQGSLDLTPVEITSAQQAGTLYGYGSPIYLAMRILFPVNGGGIGSIPVIAYPQAEAVGAVAKVITVAPVGTASASGKHTVVLAGREGLDGISYDVNIASGDTAGVIAGKIEDAINAVLGAPVIATGNSYEAILTSKWKGLTADGLSLTINTNGASLGVTYVISSSVSGSGTPSVATALTSFQSDWNTLVLNTYGTVSSVMNSLEDYNGIPDPANPTGRYQGIIMKPFVAITGDVSDNASAITDARLNNVTIAIAPAPLSAGLALEAAANMTLLQARIGQDSPHLDVSGQFYSDMPTPVSIGTMNEYANRDAYVKKGCSTVELVAGQYKICDFVTTYHPIGETPPQFRYVRNLNLDMNVRYGYYLLELTNVVDHAIANDNDVVSAVSVVKPKMWKQVLNAYADDLANRALIADPTFMKTSLVVKLSSSNPDRFETTFSYKRTGFVRIASTTAKAGFNFGKI